MKAPYNCLLLASSKLNAWSCKKGSSNCSATLDVYIPDGFLLERSELNLLIVVRLKVHAQVAIMIVEGWVQLVASMTAICIALECSLVMLLGHIPCLLICQDLHQVL